MRLCRVLTRCLRCVQKYNEVFVPFPPVPLQSNTQFRILQNYVLFTKNGTAYPKQTWLHYSLMSFLSFSIDSSSPSLYMFVIMSQPPINSPLTYN
jgi:hypothetical protein